MDGRPGQPGPRVGWGWERGDWSGPGGTGFWEAVFLPDSKPLFVEAIFAASGTFTAGQQLTLKVTGENAPGGAQKFSVYVYNLREP